VANATAAVQARAVSVDRRKVDVIGAPPGKKVVFRQIANTAS